LRHRSSGSAAIRAPRRPPSASGDRPAAAIVAVRTARAGGDAGDDVAPWVERVALVDYAFQPIVNIHTGVCIGFEALLRDVERAGFTDIQAFLDSAHRDGAIVAVGAMLRRRAVAKFASSALADRTRLFFNLDNRELEREDYRLEEASHLLAAYGLPPGTLCFELSERHQLPLLQRPIATFATLRQHGQRLAIDDFGIGFSGLQLLCSVEPDFIKIDRFFVSDIAVDPKKRLICASIVAIAHMLGITVIAEGVETLQEFLVCRQVGFDLVQGFFVQRPTTVVEDLAARYPEIAQASRADRRGDSDAGLITSHIETLPALPAGMEMARVLEKFRKDTIHTFFPIVNELEEPIGILHENALREFAYSPYGKDLLRNPWLKCTLRQFAARCPVADVNMRAERILTLFSLEEDCEGILVVENQRYVGFLSARSLLRIINEKNLALARDQNPLTRLPGNTSIYEFVSEALASQGEASILIYLDFDDFKPFNDIYGFRSGDRAIQMFGELLRNELGRDGHFVGHIGGDDFFVGMRGGDLEAACQSASAVAARFREDVQSLYDAADRKRRYMVAKDRSGRRRRYPLLSVSAAVLAVEARNEHTPMEAVLGTISSLKKVAKESGLHLAAACLAVDGSVRIADANDRGGVVGAEAAGAVGADAPSAAPRPRE